MEELASSNPVIEKFKEYEEFFRQNSEVIRQYVFNRRFMQDLEQIAEALNLPVETVAAL